MADERRSALLGGKLAALARPHLDDAAAVERRDFPGGAALVSGAGAWLLLDASPLTALGPALVWAERQGATEVHLVVDRDAGAIARRAALFDPAPVVWRTSGTELVPAGPDPVPVAAEAPSTPELATLLVDADLEVLVEDGTVRGEVLGLEVARIAHGAASDGTPLDAPLLEVGVGQADRELTAMVHAGLSPVDQLARVSEIVRAHRRAGAEPHPLNQLVPERWLRAVLVADPGRVGCASLHPVPAAVPRTNLRHKGIAVAVGEDVDGAAVVVACSVGVDLDLVPAAADARAAVAPGAALLLAVPERDAHPVTHALAARLTSPARIVPIPGDWRA